MKTSLSRHCWAGGNEPVFIDPEIGEEDGMSIG
jgi:hypothetical protein